MTRKKSLARGLDALIGTPRTTSGPGTAAIADLRPGRYQPRERFDERDIGRLADSLKANGMMQPIVARPAGDGMLEIVAGERRWRAAQKAMLHDVPVIVRDITDREALEYGLVENLQREDLGPLEEASGYERLRGEFSLTQEEIATLVGRSRAHVANTLRLLQLPETVRKLIEEGRLSAGHGRALIGIDGAEGLAQQILKRGLSVRQAEALARRGASKRRKSTSKRDDPDIRDLERRLSEATGLKVAIRSKGEAGSLVLSYGSLEQLDDIVARLGGRPAPGSPAR